MKLNIFRKDARVNDEEPSTPFVYRFIEPLLVSLPVLFFLYWFSGWISNVASKAIFDDPSTFTPWWRGAFLIITIGFYLVNGFKVILEEPPHKGLVTFFRMRTDRVAKEGLHFFPFYPWAYGYVLIRMVKRDFDFDVIGLRTPDNAEVTIKPISFTWSPDPENLIAFLNCGGDGDSAAKREAGKRPTRGVEAILDDMTAQRVRQWISSGDEGPKTWEEALKAGDDAVGILLKSIIGEGLTAIPTSGVPTPILRKFFARPMKLPMPSEKKEWGKQWEKVLRILVGLEPNLPDSEKLKQALETRNFEAIPEGSKVHEIYLAIQQRNEEYHLVHQGRGSFRHTKLGIVIHRLNIGIIEVVGKTAEAAEDEAKEEVETRGEAREIRGYNERVAALRREDPTLSVADAMRLVLIQQGKITKTTTEHEITFNPTTRSLVEAIVEALRKRKDKE